MRTIGDDDIVNSRIGELGIWNYQRRIRPEGNRSSVELPLVRAGVYNGPSRSNAECCDATSKLGLALRREGDAEGVWNVQGCTMRLASSRGCNVVKICREIVLML